MLLLTDLMTAVDLADAAQRLVDEAKDVDDLSTRRLQVILEAADLDIAQMPSQKLLDLKIRVRLLTSNAELARRSLVSARESLTRAAESCAEHSTAAELEEDEFVEMSKHDLDDSLGKARARTQEARRFAGAAIRLAAEIPWPKLRVA